MTTLAVGPVLRWLGGPADVRVDVSTGADPDVGAVWDDPDTQWDVSFWSSPDLSFSEITDKVESVRIARGKERWDTRFTAGNAAVVLDNTTGLFTPNAGEDPWFLPFRPGRVLRVYCHPDPADPDLRVFLFVGRMLSSTDIYDQAGNLLTTTIALQDGLGELHANNPPALDTATGVQLTSARVHAALDRADIPNDMRDVQDGEHTIQTSFLAQSTLEECQRAADAEGGAFFAAGDGTFTFKARDWLTTDARSVTTQGYLGHADPPAEPWSPLTAVRTSWDLARVRNDIQFARVGGEVIRKVDDDSVVVHGRRSYQRFDMRNHFDAELEFLTERHLAAYAISRVRLEEATITSRLDDAADGLNRLFYETEFGDRLEVEVVTGPGWGFTQATHVIGIEHSITAEDWIVTFQLDDAAIEEVP